MAALLSDAEIAKRMAVLEGWSLAGTGLNKVFLFADFAHAFSWMVEVARFAEEINHHPNWKNIYQRVAVTIYTHREGGLTELDFALAARMDHQFANPPIKPFFQ